MNIRSNIKIYFFLLITVFSIASTEGCSEIKRYDANLKGGWCIESFLVLGKSRINKLSPNMFTLLENGGCLIPYYDMKGPTTGFWKCEEKEKNNYFLIINQKGSFFARKYKISFYQDKERGLKGMKLESDSITMTCSKF